MMDVFRSGDSSMKFKISDCQWYRYAPSYVSPAYHLLEVFTFIQEPPSGDLQERVLIRHHFFFQAEDGIRYLYVTGVQTCALPIFATIAATTTGNQAAGTATTDALSAGYTRAFQVGAVIIALAVPIALALLRLRPTTDTPHDESDRGEEDSR